MAIPATVPQAMACGGTPLACNASQLLRQASAIVQVIPAPPADGGAAMALVGANVDVALALRPTADGGGAGSAWLSATGVCDPTTPAFNQIVVPTDETGQATFFVCANGAASEYAVTAIAGGAFLPTPATSAPMVVTVAAQPAGLQASRSSCTTSVTDDGGAGMGNVVIEAQDCTGSPVDVMGVQWEPHNSTNGFQPLPTWNQGWCVSVAAPPAPEDAAAPSWVLDFNICSNSVVVSGT
jgi:hypothetical protein